MLKSTQIAIAQFNPTVGDIKSNETRILSWIKKAYKQGASLIVFPELSLCGYPIWDLANKASLVEACLNSLDNLCKKTKTLNIHILLGYVDYGSQKTHRNQNSAAWLHRGKVVAKYTKRLLPTYDVFLEEIFFEEGKAAKVVNWNGMKVGLTICEDLWDSAYDVKPLGDLKKKKVDMVINISASPFYRGVARKREVLLKKQSVRCGADILYVNQVGAQDDLVFDGRSLLVNKQGEIVYHGKAFQEELCVFKYGRQDQAKMKPLIREVDMLLRDSPKEIYEALRLGIHDYCRKNGFNRALVGLSGGIDSALVLTLAVDALGSKAIKAVSMPSQFSTRGSWEDAKVLAKNLGVEFEVRPIKNHFAHYARVFSKYEGKKTVRGLPQKLTLAHENLQARLRGIELMYLSNSENRILLTTGNKSELAMGYCTLYGDMSGGLAVIGDVYKTDVYRLCHYRNEVGHVIPESILSKAPSAELRPNQKDEDSLPEYTTLDAVLTAYIEENKSAREIHDQLRQLKISKREIQDIIQKVDHNEYKRRQTPPVLRVTEKAWFGRRMPITNRFRH